MRIKWNNLCRSFVSHLAPNKFSEDTHCSFTSSAGGYGWNFQVTLLPVYLHENTLAQCCPVELSVMRDVLYLCTPV